jgi:hypothetical protein
VVTVQRVEGSREESALLYSQSIEGVTIADSAAFTWDGEEPTARGVHQTVTAQVRPGVRRRGRWMPIGGPAGNERKGKMRRTITFVAALAMMLGLFAGTAGATGHGAPWPEHGHMLVLNVHYDDLGEPVSYGKCVDIAAGKRLDRVHHTTIHQGRAGDALRSAGHEVVPTADLTPFANCAEFAQFFGPPR